MLSAASGFLGALSPCVVRSAARQHKTALAEQCPRLCPGAEIQAESDGFSFGCSRTVSPWNDYLVSRSRLWHSALSPLRDRVFRGGRSPGYEAVSTHQWRDSGAEGLGCAGLPILWNGTNGGRASPHGFPRLVVISAREPRRESSGSTGSRVSARVIVCCPGTGQSPAVSGGKVKYRLMTSAPAFNKSPIFWALA